MKFLPKQVNKFVPYLLGLTIAGALGVITSVIYLKTESNATFKAPIEIAPATVVVAMGRIEPLGEVIKLSVANAQDSRVNHSGGSGTSLTTDRNARIVEAKVRIDPKDNSKVAVLTNLQVRVVIDIVTNKDK